TINIRYKITCNRSDIKWQLTNLADNKKGL
ncbi:MAG: hypothetical protein ACI8RO_001512, partial [Flavobacteriales bacterium]